MKISYSNQEHPRNERPACSLATFPYFDSTMSQQTPILPDPTSDLHWSDYRGAIHEIFAKNAELHPQRVCVIETASRSTTERIFTYGGIHKASNLLAHHLVNKGLRRGDVAMVYAYRGVDLVVAVMGALKAGATFSVIDPAYPPERQKVYLEVAKPRALINIAKATSEAGRLSDVVRKYIDRELDLKAEVPALRIDDTGFLTGGTIDDLDVLDDQRSKDSHAPNVVVGPDSNPTLSFTSGSEGRPKGVLGRHFSLAYYFPWMCERFGLGSDDRFTMLSGIAHDPIQRDIFTPLFLGAKILVPSKEDIQHERLAEWMATHDATVTHLTPAMGQILVGGASAKFSKLHHAFFVGDVLTKRDCKLLQSLGSNVHIINMYGTTETQRAVSFFEIPPKAQDPHFLDQMGEIIPAGKGMLDVQLLIVDQLDRTKQRGVGQVGEIYVRAGGLAEGYLGDDTLNQKKFVENWFVDTSMWTIQYHKEQKASSDRAEWNKYYKGPRDRLYRTGDLGRYLENGNVECTGRADDQVKIRGFRIELGEINSHLSQHQLVRDSVTLVRRNKDEEPTLVSYVVPELNGWQGWLAEKGFSDVSKDTIGNGSIAKDDNMSYMIQRFRPLHNELRNHLKGKLAAYAVPTFFIPMERLPLNPNGKVDKPALPFPDIADLTAASPAELLKAWNSLTDTERAVASVWGELLPGRKAMTIDRGDSFFDLGGHSILAQQMLLLMRRRLVSDKPNMSSLFRDPTLQGFAASIDHSQSPRINGSTSKRDQDDEDYASDAKRLAKELPQRFSTSHDIDLSQSLTVFVTGASGFLGAYILSELLDRQPLQVKVIAHVRAKSEKAGLERLELSCKAYGVWSNTWLDRLSCVIGNLGDPKLGLENDVWSKVVEEVDVVIHNGAQVHWVYPYGKLKPPNVQGTIDALSLCSHGKPKHFAFVSSTSVLDTEHYVRLSEDSIRSDGEGVSEADDLEGSSVGLGTGYGQSKWVSEYLVKEAGRRGLKGTIIRPGYILGESESGGKRLLYNSLE